jgi:hypothetical protein
VLRLIDVDLVDAAWLARPVAALGGLALGLLGFLLTLGGFLGSQGVSPQVLTFLLDIVGFHGGSLGGLLPEGQVRQVRYRPDQSLVINDLLVPLSLLTDQRENFLVVQLLEAEELVEVLHLIADAEGILTVFNVY